MRMLEFQLDDRSGVATYLQLAQQVRHALRLGLLQPGDQLPTAREVVAKLAINPNTVLKAYRELEREGLVGARPGQGTFVTRTLANGGVDPAGQRRLRQELDGWLRSARAAGLDQEGVEALYRAAMRDTFLGSEGVA
jgi:GntR family transcriptional regulator